MVLLGDIVLELILRPFLASCQAMAGILYPTKSRELVRAQRAAVIILLSGFCTLATAFILGWVGVGFWTCFAVFFGGVVLLSIAGSIGSYIQNKAKKDAAEDDT